MIYFPFPNKRFFRDCLKAINSEQFTLQNFALRTFSVSYPIEGIQKELSHAFFEYYADDFASHFDLPQQADAIRWFKKQTLPPYKVETMFATIERHTLDLLLTKALNIRHLSRAEFKQMMAFAILNQEVSNSVTISFFKTESLKIIQNKVVVYQTYHDSLLPIQEQNLEKRLEKFATKNLHKQSFFADF